MFETGSLRADAYALDQLGREFYRGRLPDACFFVGELQRRQSFVEDGAQIGFHGVEDALLGVTEIDREEHFTWHDIAAVRPIFDHADGADSEWRMLARNG